MADTQELNEVLSGALQILKQHAQAVFELTADVEGLKAALHAEARKTFDAEREKKRGATAFAFDREIRSLVAAIERLRGT